MAAKDYTMWIEPLLRRLLAPDERLLIAAPLVKDPGTTSGVSAVDELRNLLDPTTLLGLGSHPGNALQRLFLGRAVTDTPGSLGHQLYAAVDGVVAPTLVLTGGRLLIVELVTPPPGVATRPRKWYEAPERTAVLVRPIERTVVVGAVKAPVGLLRRGRFVVLFADGSGCALVCSPPGLGRRAAELIGPPRPVDGS